MAGKTLNISVKRDPGTGQFVIDTDQDDGGRELIAQLAALDEANTLAHTLAAQEVAQTIAGMTLREEVDGELWSDISSDWDGQPFTTLFADEVRYAELRCMLRHHLTRPELVQLVEPTSPVILSDRSAAKGVEGPASCNPAEIGGAR